MIHALLNADFSHALETLLAVSVLILVVLMIRRPVARQFGAGVVYLLWAIPAVRFFLPPLATPLSMLNLDFAPAGQAAAEAIAPMGTEIPVTLAAPVVAAWTPVVVAEPVVQESSLSLAAQVLPALVSPSGSPAHCLWPPATSSPTGASCRRWTARRCRCRRRWRTLSRALRWKRDFAVRRALSRA